MFVSWNTIGKIEVCQLSWKSVFVLPSSLWIGIKYKHFTEHFEIVPWYIHMSVCVCVCVCVYRYVYGYYLFPSLALIFFFLLACYRVDCNTCQWIHYKRSNLNTESCVSQHDQLYTWAAVNQPTHSLDPLEVKLPGQLKGPWPPAKPGADSKTGLKSTEAGKALAHILYVWTVYVYQSLPS